LADRIRLADRFFVYILANLRAPRPVLAAIEREKQIKGWSRARKIALIEGTNPTWRLGAGGLRVGIGGGGVLRRCATQDDKRGARLPDLR